VELKDIRTGQKYNERFRSAEGVEKVRLDDEEIYNYLYTWVARRVIVWPRCESACWCRSRLSGWIWRITVPENLISVIEWRLVTCVCVLFVPIIPWQRG
jgi:hypothetical protein